MTKTVDDRRRTRGEAGETMTDLNKLADLIESRIGESFDGECHLVEDEAREAALALRQAGKMREALECIAGYGDMPLAEWEERFPEANKIMDPLDLPDVPDGLVSIARQALKTEGE